MNIDSRCVKSKQTIYKLFNLMSPVADVVYQMQETHGNINI